MIQIIKDDSNLPDDFLEHVRRKKIRKVDIDAGHNRQRTGRSLFENVLKKSTRRFNYEKFKTKLLNDQGFVCCYCNERVDLKGSSVEHIIAISSDKSMLAEYSNLLIACNGGRQERAANREQMEMYPLYCDANRNDSELPFCPLDVVCESAFSYSYVDGSISGNNQDGKIVVELLNLDCTPLREKRMDAYSLVFDDDGNIVTEQELEIIWDNLWERDTDNKHERFFFPLLNIIYDIL